MKLNRVLRTALLCSVLLCAGRVSLAQVSPDAQAADDYNFAAWLYNSGKYAMAAESYQNFVKNHAGHPKVPDALFGVGQSFFRLDRFQDAAGPYEDIRTQCAGFAQMPEVLFQLGQTRVALGQYAEAQRPFADLRTRFPDHYLADWALAREAACFMSLGKPKDAEPLLQTFLSKYTAADQPPRKVPATAEMFARLDKAGIKATDTFLTLIERSAFYQALAPFNQDRFADAKSAFERFLRQYPESQLHDEARLRLAQALYRQDAFAEAAAAYQAVAEGKSEFADVAAFERGLALQKAGKPRDAAAAFAAMAERFPESQRAPKARLYSGTFLFDAGDFAGAIERLKPLVEAKKEQADEASYWLAMSLSKAGRPADAEQAFAQALRDFPKSSLAGDMQLGLADARLAQSQWEPAAAGFRAYAAAWGRTEQAPRALYSAAVALHRAEKYAESDGVCGEFLKAYERHELAPQALFMSGENRFLLRSYDSAGARYRELLELKGAPADRVARAHFRLAWVHRYAKRYDAALEELAKMDPAAAGPAVAGEAHYVRGVCQFELAKYPDSVKALSAYLQSGDVSRFGDDALLKLGVAQTKLEQPAEAVRAFERLAREYPKSDLLPQAQYQIAERLYDLKQYGKAIEWYRKSADRQPPDELSPYALFGIGLCAYDQARWAEAADAFGQVAERFKASDLAPQALYRKGASLMKAEKWADAEGAFRAMLASAPKHDLARSAQAMVGTCLQEQKKWAEAAAAFRAVVDAYAAEKDQARMYYELGWSWREAGQEAESLKAFRALADKFPSDPLATDAFFYLAEAAYAEPAKPEPPDQGARRLKEARELYERVLARSADKRLADKAVYRIGWCLWQARQYKEAAGQFDKLVKEFPASELVPDGLFQAGQSHARSGEPELAAERFGELVRNGKHAGFKYLPEAYVGLSECQLTLGQPAEAARLLDTFLSKYAKSPSAAHACFLMGRAKFDLKEYDAALESLAKVPGLTRSDLAAQAQFYVGQVHQAREDFKAASMAYLRVQALYPDVREWVAAATFENAKCSEKLGSPEDAKKAYRQLVSEYKDTKWAELAAERLK